MSKELERYWYSYLDRCVGIIKCQDEITGKIKYYIGVGSGIDEETDAKRIMNFGDKFDPSVFKTFIVKKEKEN